MFRRRQTDTVKHGHAETRAFSLIELLVVIAIIAAVSVISVPVIRGLGQSNVVTSGTQQLVDDLMLARHKAMVGRTTVHVVFVPDLSTQPVPGGLNNRDQRLWDRLRGGGYTTYALYAERTLGDQPGKRNERYITDWRTLPEGIFIATYEFEPLPANRFDSEPPIDRPFKDFGFSFPFPTEQSREKRDLSHSIKMEACFSTTAVGIVSINRSISGWRREACSWRGMATT